MINSRKKGFTLVELVIVIAVIAILAAVLIPTFSSLVKKANLSADKQAERQLNTLLATEFATEKPEDLRAIVDMLDANGYRTSLEPLSKGYVFAWDKENNKIVLVLEAEAGSYAANLADGAKYYNEEVKDSQKFAEALKSGSDVTLSANVSVSEVIALYDDVVIDLNGHDIDFSANSSRPFELYDNASLTINAEGSTIKCGKFGMINVSPTTKNANIVINGGNFVGETDNGSFIKVRNGNENINVILNNVNYTDSGSGFILDATYKVPNGNLGFGGNLSLTIDGGIYNAPKGFNLADGEYIFKNASITSQKNTITADAGATLTIDNCSIKQLSNEYKGVVCAGNEAKITISNSTISGDADSAYAVLDTGGTIIVNNTKYETKSEYYIYPNAGSKATIIINGQEK